MHSCTALQSSPTKLTKTRLGLRDKDEEAECDVCPPDHFCPGGPGSYADEHGEVSNHWPGVIRLRCPHGMGTKGKSGAGDASECSCTPGCVPSLRNQLEGGTGEHHCTICPAGSYCPDGHTDMHCPAHASSAPGSVSIEQCLCDEGYTLSGSVCVCKQGWVSSVNQMEGGRELLCNVCPAGSYCPGGDIVMSCPAHASSAPGSVAINECHCDAGYTLSESTCVQSCDAGLLRMPYMCNLASLSSI